MKQTKNCKHHIVCLTLYSFQSSCSNKLLVAEHYSIPTVQLLSLTIMVLESMHSSKFFKSISDRQIWLAVSKMSQHFTFQDVSRTNYVLSSLFLLRMPLCYTSLYCVLCLNPQLNANEYSSRLEILLRQAYLWLKCILHHKCVLINCRYMFGSTNAFINKSSNSDFKVVKLFTKLF
jgi:hypothetical protein